MQTLLLYTKFPMMGTEKKVICHLTETPKCMKSGDIPWIVSNYMKMSAVALGSLGFYLFKVKILGAWELRILSF
jgi:hypothetical protein